MVMNKDARRYFREVRQGLLCSRKQRRMILRQIKESIYALLSEKPEADYTAFCDRIGVPGQISASSLASMDTCELASKLRIRNKVIAIVGASALAVILIWAAVVCFAYKEHQGNENGYFGDKIITEDCG